MIRLVLVFNTHGKPRLVKFFDRVHVSKQQALLKRTADLILARPKNACNFLDPQEASLPPSSSSFSSSSSSPPSPDSTTLASADKPAADDDFPLAALLGHPSAPGKLKLVFRFYATLCFAMVVDAAESELAILDLIQVLVESLDQALGPNVCELDLVFNFDRAHMLLAEIIQGGLVLETNVKTIVANYRIVAEAAKPSGGAVGA
ncbi:clathrin adaptor complex small chain-domain-containing protein, partial [Catenaria anguillulae PL171]